MENPIENVDAVEVIDSDIIDAIKTIRYCNKKRPDENTIVDYLRKSYPDAMSQQSVKGLLTWKIKIRFQINLTMVRIPTI